MSKNTTRIFVKLSGESLAGSRNEVYSEEVFSKIADHIIELKKNNTEIALIAGGGNLFRGRTLAGSLGLLKTTAHHVGMLAIMQNALVLRDYLRSRGLDVYVSSGTPIRGIFEEHIPEDVDANLREGKIVIFASGLAPFFSNDSTAVQRALQINSAMVVMVKNKVDGLYSADPEKDPSAKRVLKTSCSKVLENKLQIADASAIAHARENGMIIKIVSLDDLSRSTHDGVGSLILPE